MNKILDILDSMEMTRLKAEKNPEEFTVDAVIREFSDMLAGAFGYKNREEWIKCLEKLPESRYFHRDDAEKDFPVCYSGPENQDPVTDDSLTKEYQIFLWRKDKECYVPVGNSMHFESLCRNRLKEAVAKGWIPEHLDPNRFQIMERLVIRAVGPWKAVAQKGDLLFLPKLGQL